MSIADDLAIWKKTVHAPEAQAGVATFGETFRAERKRAGKTMGDVAQLLAVSVPVVSDVELDRRAPLNTQQIVLAADFFGVDATNMLRAADVRTLTAEQRAAIEAFGLYEWRNPSEHPAHMERVVVYLNSKEYAAGAFIAPERDIAGWGNVWCLCDGSCHGWERVERWMPLEPPVEIPPEQE